MGTNSKSDHGRIRKSDAVNLRQMITVKVGKQGTTFPVHESLVCASSTFFKSAMKPEWTAATSRIVDLTDEIPKIFELYLHWLYFKTFPTIFKDDDASLISEYGEFAKCYVLGEKLMDITFKNAVVDAIKDVLENPSKKKPGTPGWGSITTIYEGTTKGSPVRRFMVDVWAAYAAGNYKSQLEQCPSEFIVDLAIRFMELNLREGPWPWMDSMEKYHEKLAKA